MRYLERESFNLEAFSGPLDFLLHLVQKKEVDIGQIPLLQITEQFRQKYSENPDLDTGAEFVGVTALLLLMKSKLLLPTLTPEEEEIDPDADPQFAIIHHLLDYCRYKAAAKELTELEIAQSHYFPRGDEIERPKGEKTLGIEHLALEDLAAAFEKVYSKSKEQMGQIQKEVWRTSDKIALIRTRLKADVPLSFTLLFTPEMSRVELIVTFLAILELMKLHELQVIKDEKNAIFLSLKPRVAT